MRIEVQERKKSWATAKKENPNPANPEWEQRGEQREGFRTEDAAHSFAAHKSHGKSLSFKAENQTHLSEAGGYREDCDLAHKTPKINNSKQKQSLTKTDSAFVGTAIMRNTPIKPQTTWSHFPCFSSQNQPPKVSPWEDLSP